MLFGKIALGAAAASLAVLSVAVEAKSKKFADRCKKPYQSMAVYHGPITKAAMQKYMRFRNAGKNIVMMPQTDSFKGMDKKMVKRMKAFFKKNGKDMAVAVMPYGVADFKAGAKMDKKKVLRRFDKASGIINKMTGMMPYLAYAPPSIRDNRKITDYLKKKQYVLFSKVVKVGNNGALTPASLNLKSLIISSMNMEDLHKALVNLQNAYFTLPVPSTCMGKTLLGSLSKSSKKSKKSKKSKSSSDSDSSSTDSSDSTSTSSTSSSDSSDSSDSTSDSTSTSSSGSSSSSTDSSDSTSSSSETSSTSSTSSTSTSSSS